MSEGKPGVIGVIGAGTMGAGIAQLAVQSGMTTRLYDPIPAGLESGRTQIASALARSVERGRLTEEQAALALDLLRPISDPGELFDCELVIEAAPERFDLKIELFRTLEEVLDQTCVIATNTSSLSVSELATSLQDPGRLVGLHFFNPAPVMRLVEVIAGTASRPEAVATARTVGEAMGKRVIDAADIPGFIVNRCNRPYSLESLRLLETGVASIEQIDRVARMAGRFRMGPFELMDLIGIETNHAVAEGFYRQSYGEPRYQPSALQARMVASGRLGRKTGIGWYDYRNGNAEGPEDPAPPEVGGGKGRVVRVTGDRPVSQVLRTRLLAAGFELALDREPWLTLDCAPGEQSVSGPRAALVAGASLHSIDPRAAGFHTLPAPAAGHLVEVVSTKLTDAVSLERLLELVAAIGCAAERVNDAVGLVLGRIVCQLINEAAFLIGEGNGSPVDVDAGMELGVNHPCGPVVWSREIGLEHVVAVLDGLHRETGEERYRVAPLLRRGVALGASGLDDAAAS